MRMLHTSDWHLGRRFGQVSLADDHAAFVDWLIAAALARAERHSPRRIAIAHAFVAGATETDSERALTVGTSPRVAVSTFAGFDYVALGHLHRPQTAGSDIVRYSGSPLPFSFSEGHTKQVTLVDLDASGGAAVTPIDIPLGRPVATLRGTIDDLLLSSAHDHVEQHFVRAVLTDRGYVLDAKARLQERFAYVTEVQLEAAGSVARPPSAEPVAARSPLDVTAEFWHDVTNEPLDGPTRSLLAELLTTASVAGDDRQQAVKASGAPAQDAVHAASVAGERAR